MSFLTLLPPERSTWCARKSRASRSTKSSSRFPCTKRSLCTICRRSPRNCSSRAWEIPSTDKQWTQYWKVSLRHGGSLLLPNCAMILSLCKLFLSQDVSSFEAFSDRLNALWVWARKSNRTRLNNMPLGFVTIILSCFSPSLAVHNIFIKISVYISAFNTIFN